MEYVLGARKAVFDAEATRRKAEEDALEPEQRFESVNEMARPCTISMRSSTQRPLEIVFY